MAIKISGELGDIFVEKLVIAKIAGNAAKQCYGVVGMAARGKKDGIVNLLLGENMTKGIHVSVGDRGIVIDMHIMAEYGTNLNTIGDSIAERIQYIIQEIIGLKVTKVDVHVEGIRVD
jgi:uncharacterized alkaline shock family protein YloU